MKLTRKTAAAILLASLTSGAYANVTQAQFDNLVNKLFSEYQAEDENGTPIFDENNEAVFEGAIIGLADKIQKNESVVADALFEIKENVDGVAKESGENKEAIAAKADKSELDALKQALFSDYEATDAQGNPILDDEGNTIAEGVVVALANKVASNEEKIDLLSQAAVVMANKTQENADDLVDAYNTLDTKKADKTEVADLSKKLDAVNAVQDQAIDNINGLARQALINQARLDTVVATSAEHEAKIEAINAVQDQVIENVDALTRVVNDSNRITDARLKDKANTADVLELAEATLAAAEDLDARKAEKSDVDAEVRNIHAAINGIANVTGQHLNELDDKLNAVNDVQDQVIENIDGLARTIRINEARTNDQLVNLAEATLAAAEELDDRKAEKADVLALAEATLAASEELDARKAEKSEVAALDAKKADKTEITRLDNLIDEATTAIAEGFQIVENTKATKDEVAQINRSNAQLEQRVTNNSARIDQLDKRVNKLDKKLERGLASQAALSGLFQPYNVGKVNVTAAVGGYKSKTAVAVGAGYRFNDKLAAKAGVSFSTGGGAASYNVGINYEF